MEESTTERKRKVFFGVPILGFFRQPRRVSVPETRPLVSSSSSPAEEHKSVTFQVDDNDEPPRRKKTAKELWGVLREHVVEKETFHLQDWRTKTERVRTKDQGKHFKEMTLPYEFGVGHCVFAWLIYLGISILAYSVVFEHWTPIEVRHTKCRLR